MTSRRLRERRLARAAARAEDKPPPHPLAKFADKARDLDLVRKSVDDAAAVSAGLWLSYLFALFYIGIAAGGVTHKDLLLENPVRLPFLNVELPFVAFFALAPVLFVVSHAYTLMHFVLLAAKVGAYNAELARQIPELDAASASMHDGEPMLDHREIRRGLRRQLPSNIFVQFLAGPLDIREGGLGWLLKGIAWITLVFGPVSLLLLIQVQFLPYHLEWVTWVQRCAVLADVVLLWALWPAVLGSRSEIRWPRLWRHPVVTLVSLVPIGLAFVVARYPGEWVDEHVGHMRWIPPDPVTAWLGARDPENNPLGTSVHDLLFNGDVDEVTRRRKSLFSNTLVLPGFDGLAAAKIDDPKKLEGDGIKHSLVLRGRHLKGAVLTHADLRKADLEAAKLEGAKLDGAQLQGAKLDRANLQGASLARVQLQGASLLEAQLDAAMLFEAQLRGAKLDSAQLEGASLNGAQLQGASLIRAQLQGASLASANLQGGVLDGVELQGAQLIGAGLQGASIEFARLQGASLVRAELQGASLDGTKLQGGSLDAAQLQGASLKGAELDGASFADAQLQGARLDGAQIQGASFEGTQLQGARFVGAKIVATNLDKVAVWRTIFHNTSLVAVITDGWDEEGLSTAEYVRLVATIEEDVPRGEMRDRALTRMEILKPTVFGPEVSVAVVMANGHTAKTTYQKALGEQLKRLVCLSSETTLDVIHGIDSNGRILYTGPFAPGLIESILSPDCQASANLTDKDVARLHNLAQVPKAPETAQ